MICEFCRASREHNECENCDREQSIDLDEDRTGHEDWEIDPDMGDH